MKKRLFILITILLVAFSAAHAFAGETNGKCGESVWWTFADGTLTFYGTGSTYDYIEEPEKPWKDACVEYGENYRVIVESGVTRLGKGCFAEEQITSVELPDTLTEIGEACFQECDYLTAVKIFGELQKIGESAFSSCYALEEIDISGNAAEIGARCFNDCEELKRVRLTGVKSLGECCFDHCLKLSSVELSDGLQTLGDSCFRNCWELIGISIPEGVTALPDRGFSGCEKLGSVSLPASLESIGMECFMYCNSLNYVFYSGTEEDWHLVTIEDSGNVRLLEKVIIYSVGDAVFALPRSLKEIDDNAFEGLDARIIVVPMGVTTIGDRAFAACSNLEMLYFEGTPTTFGANVVAGCAEGLKVSVPSSAGMNKADWESALGHTVTVR